MKQNNNALIVLWKGDAIPDYLVQKIAEVLTLNGVCTPEMLTIKYKDEEGIANALLRDIKTYPTLQATIGNLTAAESVKQAVIYIGTRFENSLTGTNGNLAAFALELSVAVNMAKSKVVIEATEMSDDPYKRLIKAIDILSTTNAVIPANLAKKYHFTQNVVEVIKRVYKLSR